MNYYAGIGSRETPKEMMSFMSEVATKLEKKGYTLRSGGADGADLAFENGVKVLKEIYIPWKGFNKSVSSLHVFNNKDAAFEIASENHPGWIRLTEPVRKLMARNVYQILGSNLDKPVKFVICWTKDSCESHLTRSNKTGGTGLAISVASKLGIPIFNLNNPVSYERLLKFLEK